MYQYCLHLHTYMIMSCYKFTENCTEQCVSTISSYVAENNNSIFLKFQIFIVAKNKFTNSALEIYLLSVHTHTHIYTHTHKFYLKKKKDSITLVSCKTRCLSLFWNSQVVLVVKNLPNKSGDVKRRGFYPQVRKISWRMVWQPTQEFLP